MKSILLVFMILFIIINAVVVVVIAARLDPDELECRFRRLALQYAKHLHPWRIEDQDPLFLEILPNALQLKDKYCTNLKKEKSYQSKTNGTTTWDHQQHQWQQQQQQVDAAADVQVVQPSRLALSKQQRLLLLRSSTTTTNNNNNNHTILEQPQQQQSDMTDKRWCPHGQRCLYVQPDDNNNDDDDDDDDDDDTASDASNQNNNIPNNRRRRRIDTTKSIAQAWKEFRRSRQSSSKSKHDIYDYCYTMIVLRQGTHYLQKTLVLSMDDSGLSMVNYPGEEVWISGGIPIPPTTLWMSKKKKKSHRILSTDLSQLLLNRRHVDDDPIVKLASLFGENKRYIRARFPNMDPEIDQWGYNTPTKLNVSLDSSMVLEWHKPPPNGTIPHFVFFPALKNDSLGWYDDYAAGYGGICADLWGPGLSYWCSNASRGGWAEVDVECATTGRLQIPVGFTIALPTPHDWEKGSIVHAWHSQSWAMHMFEIEQEVVVDSTQNISVQSFRFAPGGGRQGGRNWCRCDQCTYAAHWCGQHNHDAPTFDDRLISGTWLVENSLNELDAPGEYYLDPVTNVLTIYVNSTDELSSLRLAVLSELIRMEDGITNVTIAGIGFRDTSPTYMSAWGVPSGGDWALHRGGAIFIENSSNITIRDCRFRRLDGNAIFLSRRTRHVSVLRNDFEWLGENAIAMWGDTDLLDATKRNFPLYTRIVGNVMRELGIYQKQSSAVAHNKAAMTFISHNIIFNVPRAAINFNDMVGGGDVVQRNLLFNTCRESGDHGPINTWDRQPFLANIRDEDTPSFVPLRRDISRNFIIANYGSSEGVDNDDGSSWYHIHHNVFYDADGFKMDYGGHDSIYEHNLVIGYPRKTMCIGFGTFAEGHGHTVRYNRCIVPDSTSAIVQLGQCDAANVNIYDNEYYAADPTLLQAQCSWDTDPIPFSRLEKDYGIEVGSKTLKEPDNVTILEKWTLETLFFSWQK